MKQPTARLSQIFRRAGHKTKEPGACTCGRQQAAGALLGETAQYSSVSGVEARH